MYTTSKGIVSAVIKGEDLCSVVLQISNNTFDLSGSCLHPNKKKKTTSRSSNSKARNTLSNVYEKFVFI